MKYLAAIPVVLGLLASTVILWPSRGTNPGPSGSNVTGISSPEHVAEIHGRSLYRIEVTLLSGGTDRVYYFDSEGEQPMTACSSGDSRAILP